MKSFFEQSIRWVVLLVVAAASFVSCSKDGDSGRMVLSQSALFIEEPGGTGTVGFTTSNVSSISFSNLPGGWTAEADLSTGTLRVTAPSVIDEEHVESGNLILSGRTTGGGYVSATLYVAIAATDDLSTQQANCFVVTRPNTNYSFDAMLRGETSETMPTAKVEVVWQTESGLLQYLNLRDGKVSFYVGAEDDDETQIKQGNVLLGAYDAAGTLLWTWHIWITGYDPVGKAVTLANGTTVMGSNLGAMNNSNATTDEILESYGLYYQWGRKEPFIGPSAYNFSMGSSEAMYDGNAKRVYNAFEASDATKGTLDYASRQPLCFLLGVEQSRYDWLYASHSEELWNSSSKSLYDPCPKGWHVPSADAFAGLSIADKSGSATDYMDKYGWELTDGTATMLFMGAGRRVYTDGKFQNVYNPLPESRNEALEAQPWVGLYWTADALTNAQSAAFYFYFNKKDVAASGVEPSVAHYRANGMPVRCVKEQ